jgi:hypothetical protein
MVSLDEFAARGIDISDVCVTKHNMIENDEQNLTLENFKLASSCVRNNRNGGSCILVKKYSEFKEIKSVNERQLIIHSCSCS